MNAAAADPPIRKRRSRAWKWLAGVVLVFALLLAGIGWWASREGSLARGLQLMHRLLPAEQGLTASGVLGSIAGGGHIERLQWSQPGMVVTIEDLTLDWTLRQIFGRDLRVRTLSAANVHARRTPRPPEPDQPFVMPPDLALPIRLTVPLSITRLQIDNIEADGSVGTRVFDDIAAHYRYDGEQHALRLERIGYGESQAQAQLQLHARNLGLAAQLTATLRNLVADTPLEMDVRFTAQGTLAGGDAASLALKLEARQVPPDGSQVLAEAVIHPWRSQPMQRVDVQVDQLNAHALHAGAPVTSIRGRATLLPAGVSDASRWNAQAQFANEQPGAWDQQRLPVRELAASLRLSRDAIDIDSASMDLGGRASAGTVALAGQVPLRQPRQTSLQLDLTRVDLRPLVTSLPRTAFTGGVRISPDPSGNSLVKVDVQNALPGSLDQERAPLEQLLAELRFAPEQWSLASLRMQYGAGLVQAQGEYTPATRAMSARGQLQRLPLRRIHRKMATDFATDLSGEVSANGNVSDGIAFTADIRSEAGDSTARAEWEIRSLQASGSWSPTRLNMQRLHLDAFQATIDGSDIDIVLPGLDAVKAKLTATAPGVTLAADAAMQQQSGAGRLSLQLASADQVVAWLRGLPFLQKRLPELRATGSASLEADWEGGWRQWLAGLRNPASQPQLRVNAVASTAGLSIHLPPNLAGGAATLVDVRQLQMDAHGNLAAASLAITGNGRVNDAGASLDIRMQASQATAESGPPRWDIAVDRFDAAVTLPDQRQPWRLQVMQGLALNLQTGAEIEVRASAGSAALSAPIQDGAEPLRLTWQPSLWRRTAGGATLLQTTGSATGIQPAWLDLIVQRSGEGLLAGMGIRTDLSLAGEWDVRMTDAVNIQARVRRERGDLWLFEHETAAGIRTLDLQVQSAGEAVNLALQWDTERAGFINARLGTRLQQRAGGWNLPDAAPLSGSIEARLADLTHWAFLAPPGWRLQGAMDANVRLGGTVATPQLEGNVTGSGLNLRSVLDGVDLNDGTLSATFSGSRMLVSELTFRGGTGSRAYVRGFSGNRTHPPTDRGRMTATGTIDWSGVAGADSAQSGIAMDLKAELQRMQVLVRNDRQMTLSGNLQAALNEGLLRIRGNLTVDRASIVLPEASAPKLGDDVVVIRNADLANPGAVEARQARAELRTRRPMDMEIQLDLGNDLALEGQGITTRLEGELTMRSTTVGNEPILVFGEVRTEQGRYRAWGQSLDVETGVVRFNGPYSNPSLNLLAIRPDIEVRAGVRVTGTLNAPRVQLYSDPDLPEGEKLSWVVLGRESVVAGAENTSMQQAALGLAAGQLSGRLASGIGLDELGLAETGVTVGKRLSDELYLTYQQGLSGAASTLFIFYDITRRLTLRAQTSEASEVDLIYTIKYD